MKTKVKRLSKRSLAVFLGVLMLVTSIGLGSMITANAAFSIGGSSVKLYFLDTSSWGSANLYYWGDGWNNNASLTKVSGTDIHYKSFTSTWTNLTGYLINKAKSEGKTLLRFLK